MANAATETGKAAQTQSSCNTHATVPTMEPLHDVQHQIRLVREALQSEKRRLGFLFGAGCPLGIYDKEGKKSCKHIPDVAGLTDSISEKLKAEPTLEPLWNKLSKACHSDKTPVPNVEHILTQLRTICALKGSIEVDGMTATSLLKLETKICQSIVSIVDKPLPQYPTAYHRFAMWLSQIKRVSPVEIFTTNYDLLLEEALESCRVPFFDGFVGTREPFFDVAAMEQDVIPPRWASVWKLHGSINWIKRNDDYVFRAHPAPSGQQLLIYPSHLKYEQSRRMPYLAMLDRLRAFFREVNSVLVICGYSFADEHLNDILRDGLCGNRSAHCFALMHSGIKDCTHAVSLACDQCNLSLLARDGAVVGTRRGCYKPIDRATVVDGCGYHVASPDTESDKPENGHCWLGNFHHFALFLEAQFGERINDQQEENS